MRNGPRGAVAIVVATTGCHSLLELDHVTVDDAGHDSPMADAVIDVSRDAPCSRSSFNATLEADADIVPSGQNFGTLAVLNIGTGINSIGMFRFDIAALPAGASIQGMTLTMPYATSSVQCGSGGSCGNCTFDAPGTFAAYYMRSDWTESMVNWTTRNGTAAWAGVGASGPGDRGVLLGIGTHPNDSTSTIELPAADIALWMPGNKVSIQITPGAGTVMVIASREKATAESCPPAVAPASLKVEYCP